MSGRIAELFDQSRAAFSNPRAFERARTLIFAQLLCLGRRTVTGLLAASGKVEHDWSADYRLFEREQFSPEQLFEPVRRALTGPLQPGAPLCAVLDDTLLYKTGRKVARAGWCHDPLGPPFTHQIAWAQRAVQISGLLARDPGASLGPARAVPLGLVLQEREKKPGRQADAQARERYAARRKELATARIGLRLLTQVRDELDREGQAERPVRLAVDGGYTNRTILTQLPERTELVGRIRRDAKLFAPPPAEAAHRGRPRLYGQRLPTPEALLADPAVPFIEVQAYAAGQPRTFRVKTIERCRWKGGAGGRDLRLVVVAPLDRCHDQNHRLFFTHPGYLIATNPDTPLAEVLQIYLWRWEIEVGFRDQKTLLGLHQGQVHQSPAIERLPQFKAFAYALLLLAAERGGVDAQSLAQPAWRPRPRPDQRASTGQLIGLLRHELWSQALERPNKSGFVASIEPEPKPPQIQTCLKTAVIYAAG